ncbi:MAG: serine/threonine protein kinase, partial [Candidatus Viridilinea halotolerans]
MGTTYPRGTIIGPYEIVSLMPSGKGGMGAVYLARPRPKYAAGSPPLVALKMAYGSHNDFLKYEIEHMERMSHPNILRVLPIPYVGTNHGRPVFIAKAEPDNPKSPFYIVVEYMRGGSIEQLLKQRKRLTPSEAVEIASQVAAGLEHIHSYNVIHLDIKDSNILLRKPLSRFGAHKPEVVISDFGISWSTDRRQLATVYGSQFYTAPERAAGGPPHPQNDIFSLGALLYEMLVGRPPFTSVVVPGTQIMEHSRPSVLNPQVSPDLERVIMKALATEPAYRYQNIQQFQADLANLPKITRPGRVRLPLLQGTREYLIIGLSSVAVLLLALILTVVSLNASIAELEEGHVATTSTAVVMPTATAANLNVLEVEASATVSIPDPPTATPAAGRPTSTSISGGPSSVDSATAPGSRATSTTIPPTNTAAPTP